ncbi:MAG: CRISPR-associated endonuclease Cas2 [Epsilonproteobacteria bacterium]|nr:CRISPR-associated endonuclease Cas2 [Campylobacterota bacterium]
MIRTVIIYDITDDKRRRLLSDLLEGWGKRVNRSVFECLIPTSEKLQKLKKGIANIVEFKTDSVRVYVVCLSCVEKSEGLCNEPHPFEKDAIYFF